MSFSTRILLFFALHILLLPLQAQQVNTRSASASEIQLKLKHLNSFGSVLYIAAHPDDENTRMISWLALEKGYRTSYMSLTRGDGGQNLIGAEQGVELGCIRTQELLAARHLDGGEQYFSSAYDFGFSKNPEETFQIWNREKVLSEVVWAIRSLKPDVIITRFTPEPSSTHGHHTASAILAVEAFHAAADPTRFPEQLRKVDAWQAKRILWNTSWFFYGTRDYDKTGLLKVDVGAYIPQIGQSVGERAAESRSQHRSQGFGSARQRGEEPEYLKHLAGDSSSIELMDGVETGWKRLPGSEKAASLIELVLNDYQTDKPHLSIPKLLEARAELKKLRPSFWRNHKINQLEEILLHCSGYFAEALLSEPVISLNDSIRLNMEMIVRSPFPVKLGRVFLGKDAQTMNHTFTDNVFFSKKWTIPVPASIKPSHPFWIEQPQSKGMFNIGEPGQAIQPKNDNPFEVFAELFFGTDKDPVTIPLSPVYKFTEPDRGELFRYPEFVPELSVNSAVPAVLLKPGESKKVRFKIISHTASQKSGKLRFNVSGGAKVTPAALDFSIAGKEAEKWVEIEVSGSGNISASIAWNGQTNDRSFTRISYTHIPNIIIQPKAVLKVVQVEVKTSSLRIGYLKGAGDEIPTVLTELGYKIEFIEDADLDVEKLKRFDVIIAGIRAYNTRDILAVKNAELMKYVEQGGRYIVQYNTSNSLIQPEIGPFPFKITRNRITVEEAPLTMLNPSHPVFNSPNKIVKADYEDWVQERGLYFLGECDARYVKLISGNDPGEKVSDGILLYAQHGKGEFIYTGLSFFRQLPAGNPGAIRLFVNLLECKP